MTNDNNDNDNIVFTDVSFFLVLIPFPFPIMKLDQKKKTRENHKQNLNEFAIKMLIILLDIIYGGEYRTHCEIE